MNMSILGGGFEGVSPQVTGITLDSSIVPRDRQVMRRGFATSYRFNGKYVMTNKFPQTPFRLAMNAGDPMSRQYASGGSNQVNGRVGTKLWFAKSNGVRPGNGASGNQHYVYDASDYIRYKRLVGKNKNYNDFSF